ncbi:MAG: tRNA pseudouridine(55) synthase TruB [Clostridia bacterium]|nr:tRNA pseudouridine(55) synthase TruB [Clostridia bacterium]
MTGLLLINKPAGISSFGVVAKVKRLSGEKKIGHTGTLDPMASGVLPLLCGKATSLSSYLLSADKTYFATAKLGTVTDTLDITGEVVKKVEAHIKPDELENAVLSFCGDYMQTPPIFSALKIDGVRLYKLAREGKEVEIKPRKVTIKSIKLVDYKEDIGEFSFLTTVSKGTYIRSLIRDIGEKLSAGAVMTGLKRTATAGFTIEQCVNLDSLTAENINEYIIPSDKAVEHLRKLFVTEKQAVRFKNGGQLSLDRLKIDNPQNNEVLRVYNPEGDFIGLGGIDSQKDMLVIKCVM